MVNSAAELPHVLILPDFERADRIASLIVGQRILRGSRRALRADVAKLVSRRSSP